MTGDEWVDRLGQHTKVHREERAKHFDDRARRRERAARIAGLKESDVLDAGRWSRDRARGQRERPERVQECRKTRVVRISCGACNAVTEHPGRCRVALFCVSCRGKIASEKRARFHRARLVVLDTASAAGLLSHDRCGGRYSEKLVTLTAPACVDASIRGRIDIVRDAWKYFLKDFNGWLRERDANRDAHWFRNFEWTPGADHRGHPHIHFWFFGPYLPRDFIETWWLDALRCVGRPVAKVIVDIRAVTDGESGANEVIKYITKDITEDGEKIDPELFAEVYAALDGARTTQASRGFLKLGHREACCLTCGTIAPTFSVSVINAPASSDTEKRTCERGGQDAHPAVTRR